MTVGVVDDGKPDGVLKEVAVVEDEVIAGPFIASFDEPNAEPDAEPSAEPGAEPVKRRRRGVRGGVGRARKKKPE